jgi:hypothetical protein
MSEHFRRTGPRALHVFLLPPIVSPLLKGQVKAMMVVGSRQELVRWKIGIDMDIKD